MIATGFGTIASKTATDQIQRMHSMTEQQLMNAGISRLNQELKSNSMESMTLSVEPPPLPQMQNFMPTNHAQPTPPMQSMHQEMEPMATTPAQFPMQTPVKRDSLPRDVLLAKARAYRDSQVTRDASQPEQLTMNMEDAMPPRLTPEPARSPFDGDLEVPSYLRRKRPTDQSEGLD